MLVLSRNWNEIAGLIKKETFFESMRKTNCL